MNGETRKKKQKIPESKEDKMLRNLSICLRMSTQMVDFIEKCEDEYLSPSDKALLNDIPRRYPKRNYEDEQYDERTATPMSHCYFDKLQSPSHSPFHSRRPSNGVFNYFSNQSSESKRSNLSYFTEKNSLIKYESQAFPTYGGMSPISQLRQYEDPIEIEETENSRENNYDPNSEISRYIEENYARVPIEKIMKKLKHSKIKSYALRCKEEDLEELFQYICPRWTTFQKIWVLVNPKNKEMAFLFKNKLHVRISFFYKHFRHQKFGFYILEENLFTPKTEKEFEDVLEDSQIFALLRNVKIKEDFVNRIDDFEEWLRENGFEDVRKYNLKLRIKADKQDSESDMEEEEEENESQKDQIEKQKSTDIEIEIELEKEKEENDKEKEGVFIDKSLVNNVNEVTE